tara:strand:+ start:1838 stop:2308 length:471 start_codon:yes stop_codon:yes gene_type:complete
LINYRKLDKDDNKLFDNLISNEGKYYQDFLNMGWSNNQIINQLNKNTNKSYGAFYNKSLVSFILGDLFNIEKISEYEILLIYVCKFFRKKGLGTKLINQIEINNSCLKKIYLEVSKNNSDAILFYKKMKFKTVYIRKSYFSFENKKIDALAMTKIY